MEGVVLWSLEKKSAATATECSMCVDPHVVLLLTVKKKHILPIATTYAYRHWTLLEKGNSHATAGGRHDVVFIQNKTINSEISPPKQGWLWKNTLLLPNVGFSSGAVHESENTINDELQDGMMPTLQAP